jgi:hypothetical protein
MVRPLPGFKLRSVLQLEVHDAMHPAARDASRLPRAAAGEGGCLRRGQPRRTRSSHARGRGGPARQRRAAHDEESSSAADIAVLGGKGAQVQVQRGGGATRAACCRHAAQLPLGAGAPPDHPRAPIRGFGAAQRQAVAAPAGDLCMGEGGVLGCGGRTRSSGRPLEQELRPGHKHPSKAAEAGAPHGDASHTCVTIRPSSSSSVMSSGEPSQPLATAPVASLGIATQDGCPQMLGRPRPHCCASFQPHAATCTPTPLQT